MPFSLSFSEEFFTGTVPLEEVELCRRPTSVIQAIVSMTAEEYDALAREEFGIEPELLDPTDVLDRVRDTDTCTDLSPPVAVWIDRDGYFQLLIHE